MNTYHYRNLTHADLEAMYGLMRLENTENFGNYRLSIEEFEAEWLQFGFNPETDAQGVFLSDGTLIAYVELRIFRAIPVRPNVYGFVHPDHRGQGIASTLLQWGIETSKRYIDQVPAEARVVLTGYSSREDGKQLFSDFGFENVRQSLFMTRVFAGQPDAPQLPVGMRFQSMADGASLEDIVHLYVETFRDHRGSVDEPFEAVMGRWHDILKGVSDFDPALAVRVLDGDEPAGVIIAYPSTEESEEMGYIQTLGVMPAYRKRGLGLQLLNHSFNQLYERQKQGVTLGVDGASLTGAVRLYERAGMSVEQTFHVFEIELRSGIELSKQ